jgi:DNA helicase-2/ATP-dependent DNA helicase PcrA
MMTIHQAKGLEYPLVIVDAAGDYQMDHPKQRFKRFPDSASTVASMEDDLGPHSDMGTLRGQRTAMQRTFEDLIRLHYVAYSRPQNVLLLVGLTKCLAYTTGIKHVGLFWRQDGTWPWQQHVPNLGQKVGRKKVKPPAMVTQFPQHFALI